VPPVTDLYAAHVATRRAKADAALAAAGYDAVLFHAGAPFTYFADDQDAPFHPTPHFAHWVPVTSPGHLLLVRGGRKPELAYVTPEDYWYEQVPLGSPFWAREYDLAEVGSEQEAWKRVTRPPRTAFVGPPAVAREHGFEDADINPPALVSRLDWDRSFKTPYEVGCLVEATKLGAAGHLAAKKAFEAGSSELEIHQAYVAAARGIDRELPYETIVALDEKGATLHYQAKRASPRNGKVLLLDAGASHLGYGSDITRTWTTAAAEPTFRELVKRLDAVQRELCDRVKPGVPYLSLHELAHQRIGEILQALEVLKVAPAEAVARNLTGVFFPHGLGHFLGIQVHDVSGRQRAQGGGTVPPPSAYPFLRTTRTIEPDMVFTVEPGIYFIEMLLRPHRSGPASSAFNWPLIDRLMSSGGVRIEDNVVVTPAGHRNLTREVL
jgi:Xaa-Pro dipeptidase